MSKCAAGGTFQIYQDAKMHAGVHFRKRFCSCNHVVTNFRITFGISIFPDVGKDWAVIRQSCDVSTFEISAHSHIVQAGFLRIADFGNSCPVKWTIPFIFKKYIKISGS